MDAYRNRSPGDKLIDTVVELCEDLRCEMEEAPRDKKLWEALRLATGLGLESPETVLKTVPKIEQGILLATRRKQMAVRLRHITRYAKQEREVAAA